jgi:hypothetical protein
LIDELVEQLSSEPGTPGMIRGAMAHLNLVMIHPSATATVAWRGVFRH